MTVTHTTPPTATGPHPTDQGPTTRGPRLATAGLLTVASAVLVQLVAAALDGVTDDLVLFAAALAVPMLGAASSVRDRRWATVTTLILTVLSVMALWWVLVGILTPGSPIEFTSAVAVAVGVVLSLWGCIAGLRRGTAVRRTPPVVGAIALVLVGAVVSTVVAATTRSSVPASAASDADVAVTMAAFAFTEHTYEIQADEPATLLVRNQDTFVHDITVPELGVATTVRPGDEVLVELTAAAGTYTIYCSLHSDMDTKDPMAAGMAAELVVD